MKNALNKSYSSPSLFFFGFICMNLIWRISVADPDGVQADPDPTFKEKHTPPLKNKENAT